MDLTKGLKSDYIRTGESHDIQIINFWYNQSKKETDIDKRDEAANRAIFKSKEVAMQETYKFHQKERRSKTLYQDSFSDFCMISKGSMGMSMTEGTDFHGHSSSEDGVSSPDSINASFSSFLPESYLEDIASQLEMFDILIKSCGDKAELDYDARKLIVAYFVFNSKYDRFITVQQYGFFEKEFEYISHVAKEDTIHFTDLWSHQRLATKIFGHYYTRLRLERCRTDVSYFVSLTTKNRV